MPQTLRTLLLTCLAWFMPLHALDAATGQRIAWDGHVWLVDSVEGDVPSAKADVASGSADPDGAEESAAIESTLASGQPAALSIALQATGLRLQRVLATRARPADDVHTLTVRSADGTLQSIRGTADHPVYVQGGDTFQALATLRPGDAVRALDGRPSTVVAVTPDPGPRTVHNLTVEFAPTYFIDAEVREGWGGIWVHNECTIEDFERIVGSTRSIGAAASALHAAGATQAQVIAGVQRVLANDGKFVSSVTMVGDAAFLTPGQISLSGPFNGPVMRVAADGTPSLGIATMTASVTNNGLQFAISNFVPR